MRGLHERKTAISLTFSDPSAIKICSQQSGLAGANSAFRLLGDHNQIIRIKLWTLMLRLKRKSAGLLRFFGLLPFQFFDYSLRLALLTFPVLSKKERLELFIKRLEQAPAASSAGEAFALLANILKTVEDEFSGFPDQPENWQTDGRMYPPQEDSRVKCPEFHLLRKYRNKGHHDFIGANGSIRIETLKGEILLNKPGQDGRRTHDLKT